MSIAATNPLLQEIIDLAHQRGLDQAALAQAAQLAPETISRAKKRDNVDLATLQALANSVGYRLALLPQQSKLARPEFGLAWSNPNASNEVLVRNALKKGAFELILTAAVAHGLPFVRREWENMLKDQNTGISNKHRSSVDRQLGNIEKGMLSAST